MKRLEWKDEQGDRFLIERGDLDGAPTKEPVVASIMVSDHVDGEEAAVWLTRENAAELRDWLTEALIRSA